MYKCFKCGSTDIEQKYWVNINTKEIKSPIKYGTFLFWCCVCKTHCEIIEEDNKLNEKLNERNCD